MQKRLDCHAEVEVIDVARVIGQESSSFHEESTIDTYKASIVLKSHKGND